MKQAIMGIIGGFITTIKHAFARRDTVLYPEQPSTHSKRWRGRIVLTKDPEGNERCVSCYLCSSVCPVDCIRIQGTEDENERRYPETFEINFSRCIFCGLCEEACPTLAIQLTTDFEMCETQRSKLVYQKEDLLIDGPGKHPHYNFYQHAGIATTDKAIGEAKNEYPPVDVYSNLP